MVGLAILAKLTLLMPRDACKLVVTVADGAHVNKAAIDFHLAPGDVGATGKGTSLAQDAKLPLGIDIDGKVRTGAWDIGADEH